MTIHPDIITECTHCKQETRHYWNDDYQVYSCFACGYLDFKEAKKRYPNPTDNPANIFK